VSHDKENKTFQRFERWKSR